MMPVAAPVTTNQPLLGHRFRPSSSACIVGRCVARRAGRAEDRHLALRAIGLEDRERPPQLAERPAEKFQIVLGDPSRVERFRGLPQPLDQIGAALRAWIPRRHRRKQRIDAVVDHAAFPRQKLARRGKSTVG